MILMLRALDPTVLNDHNVESITPQATGLNDHNVESNVCLKL